MARLRSWLSITHEIVQVEVSENRKRNFIEYGTYVLPIIVHRAYPRSNLLTLPKADGYRGVTCSAGRKIFNGRVTR